MSAATNVCTSPRADKAAQQPTSDGKISAGCARRGAAQPDGHLPAFCARLEVCPRSARGLGLIRNSLAGINARLSHRSRHQPINICCAVLKVARGGGDPAWSQLGFRAVLRAARATFRPVLRVARATFRPVLRVARATFRPVLRVARATFRPVLRVVRVVLRAVVFLVAMVFFSLVLIRL